jgi:hypothetical protein
MLEAAAEASLFASRPAAFGYNDRRLSGANAAGESLTKTTGLVWKTNHEDRGP